MASNTFNTIKSTVSKVAAKNSGPTSKPIVGGPTQAGVQGVGAKPRPQSQQSTKAVAAQHTGPSQFGEGKEPKFKIGDRVFTDEHKLGTVKEIGHGDPHRGHTELYGVQHDGEAHKRVFRHHDLTKSALKEEILDEVEIFSNGDTVQINKPGSAFHGKTGKIKKTTGHSGGTIHVVDGGGGDFAWPNHHLKSIKEGRDTESTANQQLSATARMKLIGANYKKKPAHAGLNDYYAHNAAATSKKTVKEDTVDEGARKPAGESSLIKYHGHGYGSTELHNPTDEHGFKHTHEVRHAMKPIGHIYKTPSKTYIAQDLSHQHAELGEHPTAAKAIAALKSHHGKRHGTFIESVSEEAPAMSVAGQAVPSITDPTTNYAKQEKNHSYYKQLMAKRSAAKKAK